jgi:tetratricopeptide (TPR) repeat protein
MTFDRFWGVFWVDVNTPAQAQNGFLDIAKSLEVPVSTWEDVLQALASLRRPWILVLDNADDPDFDYQVYLPSNSGAVLLTSRNAECHQYATTPKSCIPLEGLPIDDATDLLLKASGVLKNQELVLFKDARAVAELLQSHALALIQAGAYVRRGHCTLGDFPKVYGQHRRRLLEFRPSQAQSRYRDVYATFEASVSILKSSKGQASEDALELLPLLAMCNPSQLPLFIFEDAWKLAQWIRSTNPDYEKPIRRLLPSQWHVSKLPLFVRGIGPTWDSFRLVEAVHALEALALVSFHRGKGTESVSMHPLVHAWARDRQDHQEEQVSWVSIGCIFAMIYMSKHQLYYMQLLPHVHALISRDMKSAFHQMPEMEIATIFVGCGERLCHMRGDRILSELLDRLCSYLGLMDLLVDSEWIYLFALISFNLEACGKTQDAAHVLQEAVRICEETLPETDEFRLLLQRRLATLYKGQGKIEKAIWILKQLGRVQDQASAARDFARLALDHDLARAYLANHQVQEAIDILEKVLQIEVGDLVASDPHRLTSQELLASAYLANNQVKEGIDILEKVVRIREETMLESHPDRLASQQVLAGAYLNNNQVHEAIKILDKVVQIRNETLIESHLDRLTSQHNLACAYLDNNQIQKAIEILEKVVQIKKETLIKSHPDLLASQLELAGAYLDNNQVQKAIEILENVVRTKEEALIESHPDQLTSQHELACAYLENNQVQKAIEMLENVVRIKEERLVESDPRRLASQHELARAYLVHGEIEKAVGLQEKVVQIKSQTLIEENPSRLQSEGNLATCLWDSGRHSEALELLEHVVETQARVLDPAHPDRLLYQHHLANFYWYLGRKSEAVPLMERVVETPLSTSSPSRPERLKSEDWLAYMYWNTGRKPEALQMLERVVEIQAGLLPSGNATRLERERQLEYWKEEMSSTSVLDCNGPPVCT